MGLAVAVSATLGLAALATPGLAAEAADAGAPTVPSPAKLLILVRTTLIALNQANLTGNYAVLSALGSDEFRRDSPPEKLQATFAAFHAQAIDISAIALVTPAVTKPPVIDADHHLKIEGVFPTSPLRISYVLAFAAENGKWLVSGVNLGLSESPAEDATQAAPPPAKKLAGAKTKLPKGQLP